MAKKLYVGNLSYDVDSSELEQLFGAHGQVQSAQIINDRDTGRSKGFGFVEMANDQEAEAAIAALNGRRTTARLTVKRPAARRPRRVRRGGGGGRPAAAVAGTARWRRRYGRAAVAAPRRRGYARGGGRGGATRLNLPSHEHYTMRRTPPSLSGGSSARMRLPFPPPTTHEVSAASVTFP